MSIEFDGGCGITDWKPHGSTIFNGKPVPSNKYPWQAYVYTDSNFCGGALITGRHVLTAAHCLHGKSVSQFKVVLGADTIQDSELDYVTVSKIKIFPDYQESRSYINTSDIGLITLSTPIQFNSRIRPICLPVDATELYVGKNATVAGWGTQMASYGKNSRISDKLMEVNVDVISNNECSWNFIKKYD